MNTLLVMLLRDKYINMIMNSNIKYIKRDERIN